METYLVSITEISEKLVWKLANSLQEATEKVEEDYKNEKIILTSEDFDDVKIEGVGQCLVNSESVS